MSLGALPFVTSAPALDYTWTNDNGTITITKYTGPGGAVEIPGTIIGLPVTRIGQAAFMDCSVPTVTIPNTVTTIGPSAFSNCGLTNLMIPRSVTTIETFAFSYTRLSKVTIPDSVGNLGDSVFGDSALLTEINVDPANSRYSSVEGVLCDKDQSTLIEYPPGRAGNYTLPDSVTSVGFEAFLNCASLSSVTLGNAVANIGGSSFSGCIGLTNVTMPDTVSNIGACAFAGCSRLSSLIIPSGVTAIDYGTFDGCTSVTNITLPNSVTSIGHGAFGSCTSLTSVTIPNSVTNIGANAFANTGLRTVTIPESVTTILVGAFSCCQNLTSIDVDPMNRSYTSIDGVLFTKDKALLVQFPAGREGSYTVPDSVTSIGEAAFWSCVNLNSITVPRTVAYIGYDAFALCSQLTGTYFWGNPPDGVPATLFWGTSATIYYLPGTTGWGAYWGAPTALWLLPNPVILTTSHSFGVTNSAFGFVISWATNASVVVEASPDLSTWSPVSTNELSSGSAYFSDPDWAKYPARMYRLRSE